MNNIIKAPSMAKYNLDGSPRAFCSKRLVEKWYTVSHDGVTKVVKESSEEAALERLKRWLRNGGGGR